MDVPLRLYPRKFHLDRYTVMRHINRYLDCVELLPLSEDPAKERWLDYGCGSGYGTCLLANFAGSVDGYDNDPEVQAYHRAQGAPPGVAFYDELPKMVIYDTIFMVEIVEHMQQGNFALLLEGLATFKLCDGGRIVLTTPIVQKTGPSKTNPHHLCEYSQGDFEGLVENHVQMHIVDRTILEAPCTDGGTMKQGIFVLE